jgi:arylsulfatase A-like enzyme/Flp pilus assembly protein TadD
LRFAVRSSTFVALLALTDACSRDAAPPARPSILLITLDTTRADAIGPAASTVETPAFNAVAARGLLFRQAYATVPETLPSHLSMMTGLYPGGHGIHENARNVQAALPLAAERLTKAGYRTAAFVSAFVLSRRFGLARGFETYDDVFKEGQSERTARETTDAALARLARPDMAAQPVFLWVHYYDPHHPYDPPEPFRSRYGRNLYLGEIAAMDEQMGRLVQSFEQHARGPVAIVIAGDHGEGLGDHGEALHGNLLYQSTMRVPLVIAGPGVEARVSDTPVSVRRIYHTLLAWAGVPGAIDGGTPPADLSLLAAHDEVVLGEAMKPFLEYGWLPQVMAVSGRHKAILAGRRETYDLASDPGEARDLGSGFALPAGMAKALDDYPVPSPDAARAPENLDDEAKRRLAALGYVSAGAAPVVRRDAPRPADMTKLFPLMDRASALFAGERYVEVIPLLREIRAADPYNLAAALRLAAAHSSLGQAAHAEAAFKEAAAIAPNSQDVRTYLAMHYARTADWQRAVPMLEQVVRESPDRATAAEALGRLKVREGSAAMGAERTDAAIAAFERARALLGAAFRNDLELGVLYLASRKFAESRTALDRALAARPDDPMALFKRAQVSVLLNEPDRAHRISQARAKADETTRPLIERERLFAGSR